MARVYIEDKLIECDKCGAADHHPVERYQKDVFDDLPVAAFGGTDHVVIDVHEVAEHQRGQGQVKHPWRVEGFNRPSDRIIKDKIGNGCGPEEDVGEEGEDFGPDDELKNPAMNAIVSHKLDGFAHMHEI